MSGITPNYDDWRKLSAIDIRDIAVLMQGYDPRAVALGEVVVRDPSDPSSPYGVSPDTSWEEKMLISAVLTRDLASAPANIIEPSGDTKVVKESLIPWLRRFGKYDFLADGLDVVGHSQPVTTRIAQMPDDNGVEWQMKARQRAENIIERQHGRDLYPSQIDIADEIANDFRKEVVAGVGGKPLSGAYIKRHALKGISSALGKQRSTKIRGSK